MGKKSDKKSGEQHDTGPPKLPKRIAGVKLPKELRKSANILLATASSPIGREILASGVMALIAGAAAQRRSPAQPNAAPADNVPPPQGPTPIDPTEAGARAARQMVDLIGGAATAALARYREEIRKD